ncbi:MAG TPA: HAMP domain-containing sensor histidine kinase [Pirellulales bacterium]|nr:HAMP domain-containing sensor histidine kinase [Pirellulales bacterium]
MRWPIRYQILLPFAGMMLAAVLSVSLLSAYWAAGRAQRHIEEQLRSVARTYLTSTFPVTAHVLEQMHGLSGAQFVLADTTGKRIATEGLIHSGLAFDDFPPAEHVIDQWQDLHLGPIITLGKDRFFHVALRANRRAVSATTTLLHVLYPERELRDLRRQAALPPLVVGGVALALCAAVASWIARQLSLPLVEVRTQVGRLAEGDFRLLPIPARNDEVRDVAISVNELARQLDELRRAIARAERLSILGRLSGALAHHLRNDVTGALMAVQMHARNCHAADQESLDVALRQLRLIEDHLKRFLAAGQPERPRRAVFDPRELVAELVALLMPTAQHRRVELACAVPSAPATLDADRDQLRQALMNLMLNALEAIGKEGWVRVELLADYEQVRLRVLDNGAGLPPEIAQRLGEAFQTTKPEGVGLGLAVARQVAEGHGGHLLYTRNENVTCFELSLPAGDPPPAEPPASTSVAPSPVAAPHEPTTKKTSLA